MCGQACWRQQAQLAAIHPAFGGEGNAQYAAGGIRTTVSATRSASDEVLRSSARRLAEEALRSGTTTLEVKSGYGLSVADVRLVPAGAIPRTTSGKLARRACRAAYLSGAFGN